jgi:pyruvate/2-oxoglutarate dehydrogenase complex dihydrolipoamide dehydrogenase (E3) component
MAVEDKIKSIIAEQLGVKIEEVTPEASFIDETTIIVNSKKYTSKQFIIATGSRPRIPKLKGLDKIKFMTNKTIFNPKNYNSIAIIGGGPIGCEIGMALNNLGVEVHIINSQDQVLIREDKEAALIVQNKMKDEGINLHLSSSVYEIKDRTHKKYLTVENIQTTKMQSFEVDEVLVSVGRVPNIEGLNLDNAKIKYNKYGLEVDEIGRTSNKNVFAAGDIIGGMQFTHLANSHAKSILASTLFKIRAKLETQVIPRVTFTTPEIASVGILEKDKLDSDLILKKDYSQVDRAITDSDTNGFFKIIVNKKGFIKGATIVGEAAGELIGELSVAMKNKIKITKVANTIHPYPTYGYGLRNTCDLYSSLGYTEKKKKWAKKLFRLRGN